MRAFDVDLFEFSARTNVQDFDGLAGFEQSFEFEWVNCFHNVPSGLKHNEARAPALIFRWLLLLKSWRVKDRARFALQHDNHIRTARQLGRSKLIDFDRKCERTRGNCSARCLSLSPRKSKNWERGGDRTLRNRARSTGADRQLAVWESSYDIKALIDHVVEKPTKDCAVSGTWTQQFGFVTAL